MGYRLKLVAGGVVQADAEGGKQTIQDGSKDYDCLYCGDKGLLSLDNQETIFGDWSHIQVALDIFYIG